MTLAWTELAITPVCMAYKFKRLVWLAGHELGY